MKTPPRLSSSLLSSSRNPKANPNPPKFTQLQELDEMKKRLKEMEEEAAALREMQAKVEKEMSAVQGPLPLFAPFPRPASRVAPIFIDFGQSSASISCR